MLQLLLLASCAAGQVQLSIQNLLLPSQNFIRQHLLFHIVNAQAEDNGREQLAALALLAKEENRLLHRAQQLLFIGENQVEELAEVLRYAPTAANVNLIAGNAVLNHVKGAATDAPATVVAQLLVDG